MKVDDGHVSDGQDKYCSETCQAMIGKTITVKEAAYAVYDESSAAFALAMVQLNVLGKMPPDDGGKAACDYVRKQIGMTPKP